MYQPLEVELQARLGVVQVNMIDPQHIIRRAHSRRDLGVETSVCGPGIVLYVEPPLLLRRLLFRLS